MLQCSNAQALAVYWPAKLAEQWRIGHWKMGNSHIAVYSPFSNAQAMSYSVS
jgi:hypothetical protein